MWKTLSCSTPSKIPWIIQNVHPVCGRSYKLVKYTHAHTGGGAVFATADFTYLTNQMTHDTLSCINSIGLLCFSQLSFLHLSQSLFWPWPPTLTPKPPPHPTLITFLHPLIPFPPSPDILPGCVFWDLWSFHRDWRSTPWSVILIILPLLRAPIHSSVPLFSLCAVSPVNTCLSITPPSFLQSLLPVHAVLVRFLHPSAQLTFSSITLMLDWLTFCLCFLSLLQCYYFFPSFPKLSFHHDPSPLLIFHPRLSSSISLSLCLLLHLSLCLSIHPPSHRLRWE